MKGILLAILSVLVVACTATKPSHESVLRLNFHSEPTSLDPRLVRDIPTLTTGRMLFEGLFRSQESGVTPALAHTMTISKDHLTYQFELRPTSWSDGSPVTAYDFEYAWKSVLSPTFPAESVQHLFVIKGARAAKNGQLPLDAVGVRADSPYLLTVTLEHPDNYFLERLCHPVMFPIPHHAVCDPSAWSQGEGKIWIGNGPFLVKRWEQSNLLEVEKNPLYWDKSSVHLDRICIHLVEDEHTELNMYESGELDWAGSPVSSIPPEAIPTLKEQRGDQLHLQPLAGTYCYRFNPNTPPFTNVKIRQAFAAAIERQTLVDNILQAGQEIAARLIPPCFEVPSPTPLAIRHPRTLFEEGMAEMGWTRQTFPSVTLIFSRSEKHQKVAQAIQQQWSQMFGIRIYLQSYEWNVFLDKLARGDYQVGGRGCIGELDDPKSFLDDYMMAHHLDEEPTHVCARELLAAAECEKDDTMRDNLLRTAEATLLASCVVTPVYHSTACYLKNPRLHGVYLSPMCAFDFKSAYFADEG